MRPIGVCLFDSPMSAGSGWACHDGESAYRIDGMSSLRTDHLWVVNLAYRASQHHNLRNIPHLRDEQYFRCKLSILMQELGLTNGADAAVALCKVFGRVVRLGNSMLGVDNSAPGYRYFSLVQSVILPPCARQQPSGPRRMEFQVAISESHQANQSMARKSPQDTSSHCFSMPRHSYNLWLLNQDYPISTEWSDIKLSSGETYIGTEDGDEIPGSKDIRSKLLTWAAEMKYAALFHVDVLSQDKFYAKFAGFGVGNNQSASIRSWVTLPELLDISRYSKVRIHHGLKTKLGKLPINEGIMQRLSDRTDDTSFSKGVLLENVIAAFTNPLVDKAPPTSIAAYIRAYDRIVCGRKAEVFANNGYVVGSYSLGKLHVMLRPQDVPAASDLALDNGLIPPATVFGA